MIDLSPDTLAEIQNYRAHRFGITKLESGDLVLFDPSGVIIACGTAEEVLPHLLTGPEHYDTCVDAWSSRTRFAQSSLLADLGLLKPDPTFVRRL